MIVFRLVRLVVPLLLVFCASALGAEATTVAPPPLQEKVLAVFRANCGGDVNARVRSSRAGRDAKTENGKLVSGEVAEVWQTDACGKSGRVRYLFRFGPKTNGELGIVGFERAR